MFFVIDECGEFSCEVIFVLVWIFELFELVFIFLFLCLFLLGFIIGVFFCLKMEFDIERFCLYFFVRLFLGCVLLIV